MLFPLMALGWVTFALINLQKGIVCPQAFPANMQMLYPESPPGGVDTNVTLTEGVAV
jgi:hypothetical protein